MLLSVVVVAVSELRGLAGDWLGGSRITLSVIYQFLFDLIIHVPSSQCSEREHKRVFLKLQHHRTSNRIITNIHI